MLVRIDDDGVGIGDGRICIARRLVERVRNQLEVATVSSVDVNPEAVSITEREDLRERVNRANGGCAQRCNNGADIAFF